MGNYGLIISCLGLCFVVSRLSVYSYNENIQQDIQSLRENALGLVETENGLLPNTETYQENEQLVNEIYFGYLENGELDSVEVSILENIATQCPLSGGTAVYLARGLVAKHLPDLDYDDENTCLQVGLQYRQSKPDNAEMRIFLVYPNPTNEFFEVEWQDNNTESRVYAQLFNAYGQIICKKVWDGKAEKGIISTRDLSDGLYFLQLTTDRGNVFSEIIIVQHP